MLSIFFPFVDWHTYVFCINVQSDKFQLWNYWMTKSSLQSQMIYCMMMPTYAMFATKTKLDQRNTASPKRVVLILHKNAFRNNQQCWQNCFQWKKRYNKEKDSMDSTLSKEIRKPRFAIPKEAQQRQSHSSSHQEFLIYVTRHLKICH